VIGITVFRPELTSLRRPADSPDDPPDEQEERVVGNKHLHEYVCIRPEDRKLLDERQLEKLIDARGRSNAPLRTDNIRKSIEHHLERQRLKRYIADFDWGDADDHH
jgi:hypothetical protein